MDRAAGRILKTYIALTLLSTIAASFIWGVTAGVQLLALPFLLMASKERAPSDVTTEDLAIVPIGK